MIPGAGTGLEQDQNILSLTLIYFTYILLYTTSTCPHLYILKHRGVGVNVKPSNHGRKGRYSDPADPIWTCRKWNFYFRKAQSTSQRKPCLRNILKFQLNCENINMKENLHHLVYTCSTHFSPIHNFVLSFHLLSDMSDSQHRRRRVRRNLCFCAKNRAQIT